jgi:hypothetical protein
MLTRHRKLYVALFGVGVAFVAVLSTWPQLTLNVRPRASTLVEEGTFGLHKFEQPIGEEKYSVLREGDELQLAVSFHFNDRGQNVPLSAFLRMARDLAPRSMEIHGDMARGTPIDDAVLVEKDKILTRTNAEWRISERPRQFFTVATYAPAALQMMLLRRWQTAGRPKKLQTFPAGALAIEDRGPDEFLVNGAKVNLERFSVEDLAWGRETLWLDAQSRLAALVMEAIQAATLVPAKVMGLEKEAGTIEPGKRADVVILGANPLDNISNIRRMERVIQGGVVYDCAALWRSVGFQP